MFVVAYSGSSMYPTLREPALLDVVPYGDQSACIGDVVYFCATPGGRFFVHRIVRVTPAGISTRGDNNPDCDAFLLPCESIRGRVVAARVGCKRHTIAGGRKGQLLAYALRCRRMIRNLVIAGFDPVCQLVSSRGLLASVLPSQWQPRIMVFRNRDTNRYLLFWGSRTIGQFDAQLCQWLIRRPFQLLIPIQSLPIPPERAGGILPKK